MHFIKIYANNRQLLKFSTLICRDEKGLEAYMCGHLGTEGQMMIVIVTVMQPQCGQFPLTQQLTMEKLLYTMKVAPLHLPQPLAMEEEMLREPE